MSQRKGTPRDVNVYVLNSPIPITVPKGSDLLLTLTIVKEDGTIELAFQEPVFIFATGAALVRRVVATELDLDPTKGTD